MEDTAAHTEEGEPTLDFTELEGTDEAITEAVQICDFEAIVEWAIGTPTERPFRVTTLSNPNRIVVDILR
jgi:hypothetical protein